MKQLPSSALYEISNILGEKSNHLRRVCKDWASIIPAKRDSIAFLSEAFCKLLRSLSETASTCPLVLKIYRIEPLEKNISVQLQYTSSGYKIISLANFGDVFDHISINTKGHCDDITSDVYVFLDKYHQDMINFRKGMEMDGIYAYVSHPEKFSPLVVGLLYNSDLNVGEVGPYMFPYVHHS